MSLTLNSALTDLSNNIHNINETFNPEIINQNIQDIDIDISNLNFKILKFKEFLSKLNQLDINSFNNK